MTSGMRLYPRDDIWDEVIPTGGPAGGTPTGGPEGGTPTEVNCWDEVIPTEVNCWDEVIPTGRPAGGTYPRVDQQEVHTTEVHLG